MQNVHHKTPNHMNHWSNYRDSQTFQANVGPISNKHAYLPKNLYINSFMWFDKSKGKTSGYDWASHWDFESIGIWYSKQNRSGWKFIENEALWKGFPLMSCWSFGYNIFPVILFIYLCLFFFKDKFYHLLLAIYTSTGTAPCPAKTPLHTNGHLFCKLCTVFP